MKQLARALSILACLAASGCRDCAGWSGASKDVPLPTDVHRFAVGTVPAYCVSGLTEAPVCCYDFAASPVVALEIMDGGAPLPRLRAPGPFTGTCGGRSFSHIAFESVVVSKVTVALAASRKELLDGGELADAPFELSAQHPEWTISLHAVPRDSAGAVLESRGGSGYARWTMMPDCEHVITPRPYTEAGEGFARPADSVQLAPLSPGICTLRVDYFGAHTEVTVRVR